MDRVRIGMIGVGSIAELYARDYRADPRVEITVVCDTAPGVAEGRAAE